MNRWELSVWKSALNELSTLLAIGTLGLFGVPTLGAQKDSIDLNSLERLHLSVDDRRSDPLSILQGMSDRYSSSGPWYIEAIEEKTTQREFSREWTKMVMVGAASGDCRHFEGRSAGGGALHVSNAKAEWDLHPDEHSCTMQTRTSGELQQSQIWQPNEQGALAAMNLRAEFAGFSEHFQSAIRLHDEVIAAGKSRIHCYVIRVTSEQQKGPKSDLNSFQETLWIDKATRVVRKKIIHQDSVDYIGSSRIPTSVDIVTTYGSVELNSHVPDELFHFDPPKDAKLVSKFSDGIGGQDLTGEIAPEVRLLAADGKPKLLSSYRGKPVLLEFWATWCAPCIDNMPRLVQLSREANLIGLVTLTVDEDEDVKTATGFLATHNYTWPNTQDDGRIKDAFHGSSIPLIVLIDGQGKIVFYQVGEDEAELRRAIAGLGPEYATVADENRSHPSVTVSK